MIRAERAKAKTGDAKGAEKSFVKAYNEVNKDRKKKDPKVQVGDEKEKHSNRIERAIRIAERVKNLSGKRKSMQMGKLVNKKKEIVVQVEKEEKMED